MKYLIKWKDLPYDDTTWEYADDPLMADTNLEAQIKRFKLWNDYDRACEEVLRVRAMHLFIGVGAFIPPTPTSDTKKNGKSATTCRGITEI